MGSHTQIKPLDRGYGQLDKGGSNDLSNIGNRPPPPAPINISPSTSSPSISSGGGSSNKTPPANAERK